MAQLERSCDGGRQSSQTQSSQQLTSSGAHAPFVFTAHEAACAVVAKRRRSRDRHRFGCQ